MSKVKKKNHNFLHYIATALYFLFKGLIHSLFWIAAGVIGYYIFMSKKSPYDLVVGLPLMIISVGFVVNDIGSDLLAVFSSTYNRGVCVFCNPKDREE